ncbi:hypothetical protein [Aurantiacibacter zhengii]|uniref:Uncharacterized protein n=1 Tax=Aurantiacibacter zhengii TaxID=2307003 RepID=A0A418NWH5_9SPHN|nr:hypothetical protein [Aurantiacibacter zhengii]RIV88948.1 hypothetical protein D2V07_01335 [Aurantiacibacter zhengii]
MTQYRFITPKRRGKWYDTLAAAQLFAERIGAGFLDSTGQFVPYRGTVLEMRSRPPAAVQTDVAAGVTRGLNSPA